MPAHSRTRAAAIAIALAAVCAVTLGAGAASASLVAPGSACPGQQNRKAAKAEQKAAMACLINYARKRARSGQVKPRKALEKAAERKAGDVIRCGLSHTACGKPFDAYPRRYGYTTGNWQLGENLAWGRGKRGTARRVLKAWLNSPPHRATLLRGSYDDIGVGLRRGRFAGRSNSAIWVLQAGCRGC